MGHGRVMMRLGLVLAALLATGYTALLSSALTDPQWAGKCYSVTFDPPLGWGYALGDAVDGWHYKGFKEADLARRDTSPAPRGSRRS